MEKNKNFRNDLFNRFFEGKTSNEDDAIVQDSYLNPALEFEIKEKMRAHLEELSQAASANVTDKTVRTRVFENIRCSIKNSRQVSIQRAILRISKVAALIIFTLVIGGVLSYRLVNLSAHKDHYYVTRSPVGSKSELVLPDGTKIWLNAGSMLRYPVNFMDGARTVFLEGEAYFDVSKMKKKIFVVKTTDATIRVYGTQFNVKSYPEENHVQTTLVEGSLSVEPVYDPKNVMNIKPNQSVTIYKTPFDSLLNEDKNNRKTKEQLKKSPRIVINSLTDLQPIISWRESRWVFVGEELGQLALKLERRYNVKIVIRDDSLKHYKFTGTLKSQTFEQVLKIIQESAPVICKEENEHIIIEEDSYQKKKYDTMIRNLN